jgi:uncharacterized membrane protein
VFCQYISIKLNAWLRDVDKKMSNTDYKMVVMVTLAVVLLTLGLYYILFYLTSVIVGLIAGFLLRNEKQGALAAFSGSLISYSALYLLLSEGIMEYLVTNGIFTTTELEGALPLFYAILLSTAALLSFVTVVFALIGARLSRRN